MGLQASFNIEKRCCMVIFKARSLYKESKILEAHLMGGLPLLCGVPHKKRAPGVSIRDFLGMQIE